MRIAGVDLPEQKPIWVALTSLYGVGPKNVVSILQKAQVDRNKQMVTLSKEEISRITRTLEGYKIEGDLRREVSGNIQRLKETGSWRGIRHLRGLPVRGQRTRTNARTKRGKRVTIGALKKEVMGRQGTKTEKTKSKDKK